MSWLRLIRFLEEGIEKVKLTLNERVELEGDVSIHLNKLIYRIKGRIEDSIIRQFSRRENLRVKIEEKNDKTVYHLESPSNSVVYLRILSEDNSTLIECYSYLSNELADELLRTAGLI